jgi:hypothetical protein
MSIQANFPAIDPSLLLDFANTKQLDNRITFTRSTPAVYYDGKTTAMAEQNTVLYSQDIANGYWTKYQVSLSSATAPDGTSTASTLTEAITDNNHAIWTVTGPIVTTTNISSTFSIYAKAGTCSTFGIQIYRSGGSFFVDFDLTTVATSVRNGTGTSTITAVGGGWYRCTATSSSLGSNTWQFEVYMTLTYGGVSNYLGTGRTLSLWGAQAETRATASAYTATTTQPITNYIPVLLSAGGNQARFDHNPTTGESLGLLIEEQRTNLATYSADYSNAAWGKTQCSIESNTIVAPDGTLTGDKLIEDTASSVGHFITQVVSLGGSVDSSAYVFIAYAKAGQRTRIRMFDNNQNTSGDTTFNLSTGTIVSGTGTITSVGNGWYRCAIFPLKNYSTTATPRIYLDNGTSSTYTGNGFSGVYIWGGQLEVASFATSYIATTSASATRTIDAASITGINFSSWFNAGQGSAYVEGTGAYAFSCTEGGNQSYGNFWLVGDISNTGVDRYITGNYNSTNQWEGREFSTKAQKMSLAYAFNDIAGTFNGTLQFTDSSAILPINLIAAYISPNMTGWVKKVSYYPLRVTNTQLQALTS